MTHPLLAIPAAYAAGRPSGITSVCSAHPIVIEAALRLALETSRPALIEATCNQVNPEGGYTGMTPAKFRDLVAGIAGGVGLDPGKILLGGDHLGPNPWRHLPPQEAMSRAEAMIAAYAAAGFTKLHLDCSMGCAGEPDVLSDEITAGRAARLAAVAELHCLDDLKPVYVIGTEVPVPGGATDTLDHLQITAPGAVQKTYQVHRDAFVGLGLSEAFSRVIAMVVQPGVEFGHSEVVGFDTQKAQMLSESLGPLSAIVFEAHSTDYQSPEALRALVQSGFAILKVGPWLTFALREALYGLDSVADVLDGEPPRGRLMGVMDALMCEDPVHWQRYYRGDAASQFRQRHFSLSDRIRYYWPRREARDAVDRLQARLAGRALPRPVVQQYLPGSLLPGSEVDAAGLTIAAVQNVLRLYDEACGTR